MRRRLTRYILAYLMASILFWTAWIAIGIIIETHARNKGEETLGIAESGPYIVYSLGGYFALKTLAFAVYPLMSRQIRSDGYWLLAFYYVLAALSIISDPAAALGVVSIWAIVRTGITYIL